MLSPINSNEPAKLALNSSDIQILEIAPILIAGECFQTSLILRRVVSMFLSMAISAQNDEVFVQVFSVEAGIRGMVHIEAGLLATILTERGIG
jgi:hypothetical protein